MNGSNQNTQNAAYVDMEYVASQVRLRMNLDNRWHEKILQFVIDGFAELNLNDTIPNVTTAELTVDSTNIVDFPRDYVEYISIGVRFGGRYIPLVLNTNIVLPTISSCGEIEREIFTGTNGAFDDKTRDGYFNPDYRSYTVGGAFSDAYYRIDHKGGRIIFLTENFTGLEVILQYKSLGISDQTCIPRASIPALRAYVQWTLNNNDRTLSETRIETSRREWIRERNKLYAVNHALTSEEIMDIMRTHTHRGLKG